MGLPLALPNVILDKIFANSEETIKKFTDRNMNKIKKRFQFQV